MSAVTEYQADVKGRGWIYLPQLPSNTKLGKLVAGRPGARSQWTPTGSQYELAPALVQLEEGFSSAIRAIVDADALGNLATVEARDSAIDKLEDHLTSAAEAVGLDHGVPGLVAKAFGIPPWLLLVVLLFFLYAAARAYRLVPPLTQVIR